MNQISIVNHHMCLPHQTQALQNKKGLEIFSPFHWKKGTLQSKAGFWWDNHSERWDMLGCSQPCVSYAYWLDQDLVLTSAKIGIHTWIAPEMMWEALKECWGWYPEAEFPFCLLILLLSWSSLFGYLVSQNLTPWWPCDGLPEMKDHTRVKLPIQKACKIEPAD